MKQFKFSLEKYRGTSSRHICPNCGIKEFVRYVNNETEEYLEEYVGKCNRIEKCGYHYTPKQYFDDKGEKVQFFTRKNVHVEKKLTYYYDEKLVLDSLHSDTKKSNLYQFLIQYFHEEKVKNTLKKYLVGVSNFWQDAVIFWQIDRDFKVRSGKVMQYDLNTGKRDKTKFYWIKKDNSDKEMRQVFFGLHLLELFKNYKIGIVESEKTALMCDLFFDEKIIWLASGGLMGINERKLEDLSGREIILFPDLSADNTKINAYEEWKFKAEFYGNKLNIDIKINQYLNQFSSISDRENQADLADFILKDLRKIIYK